MASTLVFGPSVVACVSVLGLEKLSEKKGTGVGDAAGLDHDSEGGTGTCGDDSIDAARKPGPQPAGDNPRFFAFNRLELGVSSDFGFDLDHQVTTKTDPTTSSCILPNVPDRVTDPASGVDNAGAALFPVVALAAPALGMKAINDRLQAGNFGMLVGIGDWNGTVNDDQVKIVLFPALGIWTTSDGGESIPGGPTNPDRRTISGGGDPSDYWMRDKRFPSGASTSVDAWVNEGKLVARFDTLTLPIRSDFDLKLIDLVMHDGYVTADLSPGNGDPRSTTLHNGVLAGRLIVKDLIAELVLIQTSQTGGQYLCAQAKFPEAIAKTVCTYRDVRSTHCEDGKSLPCDSLSAAAGFDAYAVDKFGPFFEQSAEVYQDAGLLPPDQRCLDFDGGGLTCSP